MKAFFNTFRDNAIGTLSLKAKLKPGHGLVFTRNLH